MSWATQYIAELLAGNTVQFRPKGGSMRGLISSGDLVSVVPRGTREPQKGEIVLCKVNGRQYLHLIKGVGQGRYLIGNNVGGVNGWTSLSNIYGFCTDVRP